MHFNPNSHDYVLDALKSPMQLSLEQAAYLRLVTKKCSYFADPNLGSELYRLNRSKDVPQLLRLAKTWAEQALQPLVKPYYLTRVDVSVSQSTQGSLQIVANLHRADSSTTTTTIDVKVGG